MDNQQDIHELETQFIQINPQQPRGVITPNSLIDLVDSIREQGILEPLVVAHTPAGYQLIAGERRLRAAKILGLKKVPVVVKITTPQGILEMSIVENVQREDLNPIEKALAYRRLIEEFGISTSEVARRVGKSLPTISNTIRLLSLPDAIKDALVAGVISEGHVRPLISLGDTSLMLQIFKRILKENSNVRETETMAREAKGTLEQSEPKKKHKIYVPELVEMEQKLQQEYGFKKVSITQSRSLVRFLVEIEGDLEKTSPQIKKIVELILKK